MMCSRREFLERGGRLAIAGACGGLIASLLSGCAATHVLHAEVSGDMLTLDHAQLPSDGFVSVQASALPAPVYVGHNGEDEFSAVLMLCTHKACVLEPAGRYLTCPCHGSEFSATGKLLRDPAPTDLKIYRVTSDESHVYIHIQ